MPLSPGTKEIGPPWASATTKGTAPTDDRIDPDDPSLTPPIVIADGYPASFSTMNTPRRKVINELFFRVDTAILDIRNFGILPWDIDVDTLEGGIKQRGGALYQALQDNGPTYSNGVDPTVTGQTVWEGVSGTLNVAAAPAAPTAVASNGELDWSWACPMDNGAAVTSFDLQWRQQGQAIWNDVANLPTARYRLTGLTNSIVYEAQVQATNSQGASGYGAQGMGRPVASVPGGGATFALRADTGDASGEIDLDWLAPDDNGAPITQYRYQWKSGGQNYSGGRSGTTTATSATVNSLTDGTEYDFRVRAINSVGNGPNSEEASATPETPFVPPVDTVPDAPAGITLAPRRPLIVDCTWELPADDGGEPIESYTFQWRYDGDAWSSSNLLSGLRATYRRITVANANSGVQARVRAVNSVGASNWRTSSVLQSADLLDLPTQVQRFTSSRTFTWPYDDLNRASGVMYGVNQIVRDSAEDITLAFSPMASAEYAGYLWFVNGSSAICWDTFANQLEPQYNFTLPTTSGWEGGATVGNIMWWINDANNTAYAYSLGLPPTPDPSRNITGLIGSGSGGSDSAVAAQGTLWVIDEVGQRAYGYNPYTGDRDSTQDIVLPGGGTDYEAACTDGNTLWFMSGPGNSAVAFNAVTRTRDASRDIDLSATGIGQTAVGYNDRLWFFNGTTGYAFRVESGVELRHGSGVTHRTRTDPNGILTPTFSNISQGDTFDIDISGSGGYVELYPQV